MREAARRDARAASESAGMPGLVVQTATHRAASESLPLGRDSCYNTARGRIAQLGERSGHIREVAGSSPAAPTVEDGVAMCGRRFFFRGCPMNRRRLEFLGGCALRRSRVQSAARVAQLGERRRLGVSPGGRDSCSGRIREVAGSSRAAATSPPATCPQAFFRGVGLGRRRSARRLGGLCCDRW
jgi:hypothetical protein